MIKRTKKKKKKKPRQATLIYRGPSKSVAEEALIAVDGIFDDDKGHRRTGPLFIAAPQYRHTHTKKKEK